MTAEQFEEVADQLGPCELVRGEVVPLSPAGEIHGAIVANVTAVLRNWARQSGRGRVLAGEAGVRTRRGPDTVRGADVLYMSYERKPRGNVGRGFLHIPPELIVEVEGRGRSWDDLIEKAEEYLAAGIDRVWLIDPDAQRLQVISKNAAPCVYSGADILRDDAILPGFSCRVGEFFEE